MRIVALLRGFNLGGNRLSVADLRACAIDVGWTDVTTYLASGNIVGTAEGHPADLARELQAGLRGRGLDVQVLVVARDAWLSILSECPFEPRQGADVHALFCFREPMLDDAALNVWRGTREELKVRGRVAWIHTPDGFGRSKLVPKLHKVLLGTETTARNLNSVRALAAMLDE